VISIRGVKEFAFKITFKTIDTVLVQCSAIPTSQSLHSVEVIQWDD